MSETFYMAEIERHLERVSAVATSGASKEQLEEIMKYTENLLIKQYGLDRDDAQNEVAAAAGLI